MINFEKYGIKVPIGRTSGNIKLVCPNCKDHRGNPKDKSLSVNVATGEFKCHHCGWKGCAADDDRRVIKMYTKPSVKGNGEFSAKMLAYFKMRGISDKTIKAAGITESVEYIPQAEEKRNCICFNYYKDGELVNTKFRDGQKNFKLVAGAKLIPYNIDSIRGEKDCIITEGEFDALTYIECGFKSVISIPNGANENLTYLDDFIESHFDDKEVIYIATDTDTKGVLVRNALIRRLGDVCRIVEYGEDCKDANELMVKHGADAVKQSIKQAKEIKISGELDLRSIDADIDYYFEHGTESGFTIGFDNFDKLMSFKTGLLYVVTGIPSSGKSEFIDEICERLNWKYQWRFGVFSPENEPYQLHIGKIISKITGKRFAAGYLPKSEYYEAKEIVRRDWHWINPEKFTLEEILKVAKSQIRRYGINMLIIDPYNRIEVEGDERTHIKNMLIRLRRFAADNDILVMLMAHPAKPPKEGYVNAPTLYDISGSADFYNMMDFGLVVHRNRDDNTVHCIVRKCRFKNLGGEGEAVFKYTFDNGRYSPIIDEQTIWDTASHLLNAVEVKEEEMMSEREIKERKEISEDFFTSETDDLPF